MRDKTLPLILFTYIHLPKDYRGSTVERSKTDLPRAAPRQASTSSFSVSDVPTVLPLLDVEGMVFEAHMR